MMYQYDINWEIFYIKKIKDSPNAVKIQREYCYVYHPEKNAPIIDV
jgi:hypothetical protein